MEKTQFTFLLESYKSLIEYYCNYTNGTWTRFSILLTLDLGLAGFLVTYIGNFSQKSNEGFWLIVTLGLIISILLYVQSAQERYVISHQRDRINTLRKRLQKITKTKNVPTLFVPLDEIDRGNRNFIFESIVSWRSKRLSITRLPTITSLILILIWITVIYIFG